MMSNSNVRGKDYLENVTEGNDTGTANSSYPLWATMVNSLHIRRKFTTIETLVDYRYCFELRSYDGLKQGMKLAVEDGGVYTLLGIYYDKYCVCRTYEIDEYGVYILFCNTRDEMVTVEGTATYHSLMYEIVRYNPADVDYIISFGEWWATYEFAPEGVGEFVNLLGGGYNNVTQLPDAISKCTDDVKGLGESISEISHIISTETNRVKTLLQMFTDKDPEGVSILELILSRVEDFSLLALGLISCTSIKTAIIMCLQYYKTFVKGPALMSIMRTLTSLFETVRNAMSKPNGQLKAESTEESGFVILDIVRWLSSNWKFVMEGDVVKHISNALTILMAFVCGDDETEKFVNQSTFHLFKAKVWDFSKGSKGFIDMILSTLQFFLEKGLIVMKTGNFGSIFYTNTQWQDMETEYNDIVNWSKLIATNQLGTIGDVSEGKFSSEEDYRFRLHQLKDKFYEYHKMEKNSKNRSIVTGYLLKLGSINVSIQMQKKAASFKEAPFCVLLHGESAVGKSLLMNVIAKCIGQANGWPCDFENIVSPNEADEYDTEYNDSIHTILFIDDILQTKVEWYKKPPTDRVLRCKNNIPITALKADVESKGLMQWLVKLMVLSTNVKSLKSHLFSNVAAAIMRRIDVVVNVYLKDVYKDHLGCFKNSTGERLPSAWNFRVQEVKLMSNGSENVETSCTYEFEDIYSTDNISELLKFLALKSRVHTMKQKHVVSEVLNMFDTGFCPHFMIKSECKECANNDAKLGISEIRAIAADQENILSRSEREILAGEPLLPENRHLKVGVLNPVDENGSESDDDDENDSADKNAALLNPESTPEPTLERQNSDDDWEPIKAESTFGDMFKHVCTQVGDGSTNIVQQLSANWPVAAAFGAIVGLIAVMRSAITISAAAESLQEKDPVLMPGEVPNPWVAKKLKRVPLLIRRSKESASTTHIDLRDKVARNVLCAKVSFNGRSTCFNICPMENNYWLAPYHSVNHTYPLKIMVTNCQKDETGIEVKEMLSAKSMMRIPGTDYAILRLKCVQPRKGFIKFLPEEHICGDSLVATCIYRPRRDWFNKEMSQSRDAVLQQMEQSLGSSGCYTSLVRTRSRTMIDVPDYMSYQGFHYTPDHYTFNGMCGMVMVLQARGAVIMGMHLAGDGEHGVAGALIQSQVSDTIASFSDDLLPMKGDGGVTEMQYDYSFDQYSLSKEGVDIIDDVNPKHCMRFMDADRATAVEVYGPHEKGTRTLRSDVKKSLISDTVAEVMDLPRIHGKPKGIGTWRPFQENAQEMMEPSNLFDPDLLESCVDELVERNYKIMKDNDLIQHVHFVSVDVAINGVPGMTGFDRIDLSSSAGHPLDSPKTNLIDYDKSEIDANGVITKVVFEDSVYESVETLKQKALNGERLCTIFRANVKDEATKFTKDKLRIFAGTSLDYLLLCKQALSGLNRVYQMHWDKFECCISANCYDDDWTKLYRSIWREGRDNRFFCGDYKHWDKSLCPQLLAAGASVVYRLVKRCGYNEAELAVVSAILQELVYPIYEWDGMYIQFLSSLPSGVFVTVLMSNTCNSLLFRYTFYTAAPSNLWKYDDHIVANFMGDDNIGTVSPECTWWDQLVHARILGEKQMTYTSADKKSALKPFYTKDDATYLKRKFVWNERLQQYLAPIEEASLQKPLHNYMKRKKSLESLESLSGNAIDNCINEYFRMGEEIYTRRSLELLEVVKRHDLWKNCSRIVEGRFPTYSELCTEYLKKIEEKQSLKRASELSFGKSEAEADEPRNIASNEMKSINNEEKTIKNVTDASILDLAKFQGQTSDSLREIAPEGTAEKLGVTFSENKHVSTEIVTFDDIVSQNAYDISSDLDSTFSMQDSNDDDLANFFARPIKVYQTDIEVNTALKVSFNPWTAFFSNPRVINRICNFNLLRCNLCLRFLINGNSFYYGRFIASYLPLAAEDELAIQTVANRYIDHVTLASQRPHVYLDPTTSQGGEMVLPFFFYNSNISIPFSEWALMGEIFIDTIANLQHANSGTASVKLSVFAYATDVKLSIPTSIEPGGLVPQGTLEPEAKDETELVTGKISGPASALAKGAATIAMYPPIRPYAMAASYVAEATAGIARLFGYSRPKLSCNPPCRMKPEFFGTLTNTDVAENVTSLALDSKQEVTIDPRVAGLSSTDQMTLASIVAHESYFHSLTWSTADATETCLGQIRVDPAQYRQLASAKFLTSTAFASLPFMYWTGTLNFRFQIICSGFHRGRLRITYDPVSVSPTSTEYNINYTHVVDISETKDITVSIPPCQHRPLMKSAGISTAVMSMYTTGGGLAAATSTSNGVLSVHVVNDLTIPALTAADVTIAVFISANDDFAVWNPHDAHLGAMVLKPQGILEPEGMDEEDSTVDANTPVAVDKDEMIKPAQSSMYEKLAMIYTGENVPSIRSWLKRYCHHFSWGPDDTNGAVYRTSLQTSAFPFNRGNVNNAVHLTSTAAPYNYCNTTLLNYLSWAYVGWRGSIRWKVGLTERYANDGGAMPSFSLLVSRQPEPAAADYAYNITAVGADNTESTNAHRILEGRSDTFWDGTTITPVLNNPVVEIDIPYQSNKRFQLCRIEDRTSSVYAAVSEVPGKVSQLTCNLLGTGVTNVDEYVAIGDDFSLLFYIGPPVMYLEQSFPAPSTGV